MDINLDPLTEDEAVWRWHQGGAYSSRSAYNMLCEGAIRVSYANAIWRCWELLSCKIFMWLAIQYRMWTSDRRMRHGLQDQVSPCFLCNQEHDNVDHILLHCVYSRQLWFRCFQGANIKLTILPTMTDRLESWWCRARKSVPKDLRKGFDSVVTLICWSLWKQRNDSV